MPPEPGAAERLLPPLQRAPPKAERVNKASREATPFGRRRFRRQPCAAPIRRGEKLPAARRRQGCDRDCSA